MLREKHVVQSGIWYHQQHVLLTEENQLKALSKRPVAES